jgi:hypothetical protein
MVNVFTLEVTMKKGAKITFGLMLILAIFPAVSYADDSIGVENALPNQTPHIDRFVYSNSFDTIQQQNNNDIVSFYKDIENGVVSGYKAVEKFFVSGYKAVENFFVSSYRAIENRILETFQTVNNNPTEEQDNQE